jgi:hypothetical protein
MIFIFIFIFIIILIFIMDACTSTLRKAGRQEGWRSCWSLVAGSWSLHLHLHQRDFKERRRLAAEYFLDGAGPAPLVRCEAARSFGVRDPGQSGPLTG